MKYELDVPLIHLENDPRELKKRFGRKKRKGEREHEIRSLLSSQTYSVHMLLRSVFLDEANSLRSYEIYSTPIVCLDYKNPDVPETEETSFKSKDLATSENTYFFSTKNTLFRVPDPRYNDPFEYGVLPLDLPYRVIEKQTSDSNQDEGDTENDEQFSQDNLEKLCVKFYIPLTLTQLQKNNEAEESDDEIDGRSRRIFVVAGKLVWDQLVNVLLEEEEKEQKSKDSADAHGAVKMFPWSYGKDLQIKAYVLDATDIFSKAIKKKHNSSSLAITFEDILEDRDKLFKEIVSGDQLKKAWNELRGVSGRINFCLSLANNHVTLDSTKFRPLHHQNQIHNHPPKEMVELLTDPFYGIPVAKHLFHLITVAAYKDPIYNTVDEIVRNGGYNQNPYIEVATEGLWSEQDESVLPPTKEKKRMSVGVKSQLYTDVDVNVYEEVETEDEIVLQGDGKIYLEPEVFQILSELLVTHNKNPIYKAVQMIKGVMVYQDTDQIQAEKWSSELEACETRAKIFLDLLHKIPENEKTVLIKNIENQVCEIGSVKLAAHPVIGHALDYKWVNTRKQRSSRHLVSCFEKFRTPKAYFIYNTISYLLFLCLLSIAVLGKSDVSRLFHLYVQEVVVDGFVNISDKETFWEWTLYSFVDKLFPSNEFSHDQIQVLGTSVIRQQRVQLKSCLIGPDNHMCAPSSYSLGEPQTGGYWQNSVWTDDAGFGPFYLTLSFVHRGGYTIQLPGNRTSFYGALQNLSTNGWIDQATRSVALDVVLYSNELEVFSMLNLIVEFSNGLTFPKMNSFTIPFDSITKTNIEYTLYILMISILAGFIFQEIQEIITQKSKYLTDYSNAVDWITYIPMAVVLCFFLTNYGSGVENLNNITVDNLDHFSRYEYYLEVAQSGLTAFFWIRLVFYLRVSETTGVLGVVIMGMLGDVIEFILLAVILLMSFTMIFFTLFGTKFGPYQTFPATLSTLLQSALGGLYIFGADTEGGGILQTFGNVLMIIYLLLSAIVLVNLLIAMMSRTYSKTFDQSQAVGVWRLQFAYLVRQYNYDILPPPLNLLWLVVRIITFTIIYIPYVASGHNTKNNIFGSFLKSGVGRFISNFSGGDLVNDFKDAKPNDLGYFWRIFQLSLSQSYESDLEDQHDDSASINESLLVVHYQKNKSVELVEVPIEFKSEEPDDSSTLTSITSAVTKRKLAKESYLQKMSKKKKDTAQPRNESESSDDESYKTFRSGLWKGYYVQDNQKFVMSFKFKFTHGKVSGEGQDGLGEFFWSGIYSNKTQKITVVKKYKGAHEVFYEGEKRAPATFQGTWSIPNSDKTGEFFLQKVQKLKSVKIEKQSKKSKSYIYF